MSIIIKGGNSSDLASVKPASTSPLATDPALVVSLSPNSPAQSVSGTITANQGTAGGSSWLTKDAADAATGTTVPATALQVGGTDGTNLRALSVNNSGQLNINNISGTLSLPTGAATSALQTTGNTSLATIATNTTNTAQGASSSGVLGGLAIGVATTSAPSYTTATVNALSLTLAGALRVDGSGATQPVSGTVTANAGTNLNTSLLALDTSVNGILVSQGSTTSGQKGSLHQGAVTTAAPTYTTGQTSPLSINTSGGLRVDGSGVTQPISGTVTANAGTGSFTVAQATASNLNATIVGTGTLAVQNTQQGTASQNITQIGGSSIALGATTPGASIPVALPLDSTPATANITAADAASTTTFGQNTQAIITGTPTAGSVANFAINNLQTVRVQVTGTWTATLQSEVSFDGGTTWYLAPVQINMGSLTSTMTSNFGGLLNAAGLTNIRIRCTSFTSGTATVKILQTANDGSTLNIGLVTPIDGYKATYYASVASLTPAATPTDVFTIYGSASKTIRILGIQIAAIATTAGTMTMSCIKRSTANTGGTSASAGAVSHDSANAAATATSLSYTANPTALGTTVGTIYINKLAFPVAGGIEFIDIDLVPSASQAVVLRGTAQGFAINLNGGTVPTGGSLTIGVRWTEE